MTSPARKLRRGQFRIDHPSMPGSTETLAPGRGGAAPQTVSAPLPVPIPALPRLPGEPGPGPSLPGLPDFSGAIRAFTQEWMGLIQIGAGVFILIVGGSLLVLSTRTGQAGARAAAMATPVGRAASLVL